MSKLSFRARALDVAKSMPVVFSDDNPDILNEASITRVQAALPTGMEKEEEHETHIAQAIRQTEINPLSAAVVIPTPKTTVTPNEDQHVKDITAGFLLPKQYIRTQLWELEDEAIPDYDVDSEDEVWLGDYNKQAANAKFKISEMQYERLMDLYESAAMHNPGNKRKDESTLLEEVHEHIRKAVHQRFMTRLQKLDRSTVTPQLKAEAYDGSSGRDPYVAFRRRTERMHTRKNQKNTEQSFANMLKLQRDLERCRQLMGMVKQREVIKKDLLRQQVVEINERFNLRDWDGSIYGKIVHPKALLPPDPKLIFRIPKPHDLGLKHGIGGMNMLDDGGKPIKDKKRKKEERMKRKREEEALLAGLAEGKNKAKKIKPSGPGMADRLGDRYMYDDQGSESDEGDYSSAVTESEYEHEDPFRLRRRYHMFYHAPLRDCPVRINRAGQYTHVREPKREHTGGKRAPGPKLTGWCRRRIGRGGRVFVDRCRPDYDMVHELTHLTKEQEADLAEQQARLKDMREKYALQQKERARQQKLRELQQKAQMASMVSRGAHPGMQSPTRGPGVPHNWAANPAFASAYKQGAHMVIPRGASHQGLKGVATAQHAYVRPGGTVPDANTIAPQASPRGPGIAQKGIRPASHASPKQ